MLEFATVDQRLSKDEFAAAFEPLAARLAAAQRGARAAGLPVIVVFEGWDASGKGTAINQLAQTLDPRGFSVHLTLPPKGHQRHYPWMRRFWNALPAEGRIALFDRSWYSRVLGDHIERRVSAADARRAMDDIRQFEKTLTDSGAVVVKFWLHISRRQQAERFRRLRADHATAWRVGKAERKQHRRYRRWREVVEQVLRASDFQFAPWTVVAAGEERAVHLSVFETLVEAIESALARRAATRQAAPPVTPGETFLASAAIGSPRRAPASVAAPIDKAEYRDELAALQKRLARLEHQLYVARTAALVVYEGWDAAGKGGNIRRLTAALDPRGYEVIPIGPPTEEEKAHHYLWRFWQRLPKAGHIALFDRSWYGRVLVERVEGFCPPVDWRRAYGEINQFERQLTDFGTVVVKFWLEVDRQEQLRRFEARRDNPEKQWKITDEDWRNRAKWDDYQRAIDEMLDRTSTPHAPWTILEANDKRHARLKALQTVAAALETALDGAPGVSARA